MSHIHTQPGQHDYTVGAYIVSVSQNGPRVLLHLHRKMGMLLPIGGHIELDETLWQAVGREIREEAGFLLSDLSMLQPPDRISDLSDTIVHPYPVIISDQDVTKDHFHTDVAYGFVALSEASQKPDAEESTDLRWLTKSELLALTDDVIFPNTKEIYLFILDVALVKWQQVETSLFKI